MAPRDGVLVSVLGLLPDCSETEKSLFAVPVCWSPELCKYCADWRKIAARSMSILRDGNSCGGNSVNDDPGLAPTGPVNPVKCA